MIGYIKGKIISHNENKIVVLTSADVGYELFVPSTYLVNLNKKNLDIELFVKTIVRELEIELYGFLTEEEKDIFAKLINVTKLGPKTALTILSHINPNDLISAILKEDIGSLSKIKGIGKKTAKRIILELKENISKTHINSFDFSAQNTKENSVFKETLSALMNLGYKEEEISPVITQILNQEPDLLVEEAIRSVLKNMAKNHGKN